MERSRDRFRDLRSLLQRDKRCLLHIYASPKQKSPVRRRTGQTFPSVPGSAPSSLDDSAAHILRSPRKTPLGKSISFGGIPFPVPPIAG
jgi:hypothetical protein